MTKKVKMVYKSGDIVKLYKNTTMAPAGGVVKVIDRDVTDKSYFVGESLDEGFWVKEDDCELITFDRPVTKSNFKVNVVIAVCTVGTLLLGVFLGHHGF